VKPVAFTGEGGIVNAILGLKGVFGQVVELVGLEQIDNELVPTVYGASDGIELAVAVMIDCKSVEVDQRRLPGGRLGILKHLLEARAV
jgi:hypothetical protein